MTERLVQMGTDDDESTNEGKGEVMTTPTKTTEFLAEIMEVNIGMPAASRCDRCGAQAFVEAEVSEERTQLLFCAHHWAQHKEALAQQAIRIFDHTPSLRAEEHKAKHRAE